MLLHNCLASFYYITLNTFCRETIIISITRADMVSFQWLELARFAAIAPPKLNFGGGGFPIRKIELWASPTYVELSLVSALSSDSKQARFLM